ncbi:MAG: hypothetical protein AUF67_02135 [Acidobacteria bacterium 13_1_20CM_58_21]|nr:MAG: hypothetical protein AUF67_02135 [Acidobacteria bacterium 13_1_20CM_58_21]
MLWLSESHELLVAGSFNRIKVRRARGGVCPATRLTIIGRLEDWRTNPTISRDYRASSSVSHSARLRSGTRIAPTWGGQDRHQLNCVDLAKPEPSQEFAFSNGEGDVAAIDSFSRFSWLP